MTTRPFPLLLFAAALAGCVSPSGGGPICTTSIEPAVIVKAHDAVTGENLIPGIRGALHDGTYVDSLRPTVFSDGLVPVALSGAPERPGRYRVELVHPGYRNVTLVGIEVREGICHVETQAVDAAMEAESALR